MDKVYIYYAYVIIHMDHVHHLECQIGVATLQKR